MRARQRRCEDSSEKGQGLVEFALVALFLLLTVFAIIDFSRVFFGYATMSNGVREGARYAIVQPSDEAGIKDAARAMMLVIGAPVVIQVTFPEYDQNGDPYTDYLDEPCTATYHGGRCPVVVTARSDFPVWTPIVPSFTMVTSATMHIE
jgi:Flp pilus assembly protein TadG